MGTIHLSFHINAPIERVATLYQQIERIPEWQYDILEVKDVDGPLRVGASYTMVYWRMGRRLEQRMVVTQYDPPRVMQQTANTPLGGRMTSTTHLQSSSDGGTDVRWQMEYYLPGGFLGVVLDRLLFRAAFERTVKQYNENFKALAEGTEPPYKPIQGRVIH